ncbi:hypothetical protein BDB01DRAFT_775837 [Pilobolus umbonatus]|nr:hypothetical protein BDB01DRAFT_775837 [Pilobolus umbonatus]
MSLTIDHIYRPNDNPSHYGYHRKLCASHSTPLSSTNYHMDYPDEVQERHQFMKEISQVREDILRFRSEMNGLAKQMNGMEIDLNYSRNRVREIENGLTATQEVNVNLQIMLENAVDKQKESDVYANQTMKHLYTNLATVVHETKKLRGRLTTIADYQRHYQGNATDVAERIREYSKMLEQAQGTIQSLKTSRTAEEEDAVDSMDINTNYMDRSMTGIIYPPEEDNVKVSEQFISNTPISVNRAEMYKHRIIKKRASNPDIGCTGFNPGWLPQKGLRILLNDCSGLKGI